MRPLRRIRSSRSLRSGQPGILYLRDQYGWVGTAEKGASGDENVSPSRQKLVCAFLVDSSIALNEKPRATLASKRVCVTDFIDAEGNELLSAKARVHRHDQKQIDVVEHGFHRAQWGGRYDREPRMRAKRVNPVDETVGMHDCLGVKGHDGRTSVDICVDRLFRIPDHEVYIERKLCNVANVCDHLWAEGKIRNEMTVHYVEVQDPCPALFYSPNFIGESGKIGSENARSQAWNADIHARIIAQSLPRVHPVFLLR